MGSYVWPCPSYTSVSSPFGNRKNPLTGSWQMHSGVDLACVNGKDILAARAGTVTVSGWQNSYGNVVYLDHGGGITSRYAHCSKLNVSAGAKVAAGQVIARVGSTGDSTGPHLHFEIRMNGTAKNPLNYVSPSDTLANFSGSGGGSPASGSSSSSGAVSASKEITTVVVQSVYGSPGTYKYTDLKDAGSVILSGIELMIQNDKIYIPPVTGDMSLQYERKGSPGTLKFEVMQDEVLNIQEGNPVRLKVNGQNVFYGYIFEISRSDYRKLSVTCYDQIRYLKNKDTFAYSKKKYSELLKMIANDYGLKTGTVEDTKHVIAGRVEEDTLLDILYNAADETVLETGNLYVLYDDFGALSLRHIENMLLPILMDEDTAGEFKYKSTIDKNVYNRIKLAQDNDSTGQRELYVANDAVNQSSWGILQYYESISDATPALLKEKSRALLAYYNKKSRALSLSKCFGDIRVRGGSSLVVKMNLGDLKVQNYMVVEKVKHTFSHNQHTMDLDLSGIRGEFNV